MLFRDILISKEALVQGIEIGPFLAPVTAYYSIPDRIGRYVCIRYEREAAARAADVRCNQFHGFLIM
jgi:hypothetical protein